MHRKQAYGPEFPAPDAGARDEGHVPLLQETQSMSGHAGAVLAARFNQQGTYCLSCGKDRLLRLWNPHKGLAIKSYQGHGYQVRDVTVRSDNSQFASCGGNREVYLWDVKNAKVLRRFRGHDGAVNSITYAAEDEVLVSGGYDQFVKVWDCRSRSIDAIQAMKTFKDSVMSVRVTSMVEILAASVDGSIQHFDMRKGLVYSDNVHVPVSCAAASVDGKSVLAACLDSRLRLLDRQSGKLMAVYEGHQHESSKADACFLSTGSQVIACSEDGRLVVWDLVSAKIRAEVQAHGAAVTSLDLHPGPEQLVLSASADGTIKLFSTGLEV